MKKHALFGFLIYLSATFFLLRSLLGAGFMTDDLNWIYYDHFYPLEFLHPSFRTMGGYGFYRPMTSLMYILMEMLGFGISDSTPFQIVLFLTHAGTATLVSVLAWMCWRSWILAACSGILFLTGLLNYMNVLCMGWFNDAGWLFFAVLSLTLYLRGRWGWASVAFLLSLANKESALCVMPMVVVYEAIQHWGRRPWIKLTLLAIWKKQKWFLLFCLLHSLRTLWAISIATTNTASFWGPHLSKNFLMAFQWMMPYQSPQAGGEHYGQEVLRQAWIGLLFGSPILVAWFQLIWKGETSGKTVLFFMAVFLLGFFPWIFLPADIKPQYALMNFVAVIILLPYGISTLARREWAAIPLTVAAAISFMISLPRQHERHHASWICRDNKAIFQQVKTLVPSVPNGHIFIFEEFRGSTGSANGNFWRTITLGKDFGLRIVYDNPTLRTIDAERDILWISPTRARVKNTLSNEPYWVGKQSETFDLTPSTSFSAFRYEHQTLTNTTSTFFARGQAAWHEYQRGLSLQKAGKHPEAITAFMKANETLTWDYHEFYLAMADSFLAMKRHQEAMDCAQRALRLCQAIQRIPDHIDAKAWYAISKIYQVVGNAANAELALRKAYESDPDRIKRQQPKI